MNDARYRLLGSVGSPYALKLRALMRYRRLPFDWVPTSLDWVPEGLPHPPLSDRARREISDMRPAVLPAVWFPKDRKFRNDSTLIAYELETQSAGRQIVPPDPAWALCSHILEDMADEWGVKVAFNYRWGYERDSRYKSRIVVGELLGGGYSEDIQLEAAEHFARRQIGRMPLVGCTDANRPVIEKSFRWILDAMGRLPATGNFIFGSVPSLADFGWYGQLLSLATDPTPAGIIDAHAPATFQYLQLLEDASGIDADWPAQAENLPDPAMELLRMAGMVYLPFLHANALAYAQGAESFSLSIDGDAYTQKPFRYQVKCLNWLIEEYGALEGAARERADAALAASGCLPWLRKSPAQ